MTIPIHVNNAQTTFGASYSPGGSTLVMATGFGSTLASRLSALGLTLDASNPIRVTAIKSTAINIYGQITDLSKLTIFQATGRSTDTLTGVTVVEGTTDQAYVEGDTLAFLWTAGAAQALRDAIVAGGGTVSSIAMTVPSGLSVSGSPITTSGTLAVTLGVSGLLKGSGGSIVAASAGTDYAAASHTHDDRYYTESEVDALISGVSDHGSLSGLADDDHAQYALLDWRSGDVMTAIGGTDSTVYLAFNGAPNGANRNDYNGTVGYSFIPSAALTVTHLGRHYGQGNTGNHQVGIWSEPDGTLVASGTVLQASASESGYKYVSITPVVLSPSKAYSIGSLEVSGGDIWSNFWTVTTAVSPRITFTGYRYDNAGGTLAWPSNSIPGLTALGAATFKFTSDESKTTIEVGYSASTVMRFGSRATGDVILRPKAPGASTGLASRVVVGGSSPADTESILTCLGFTTIRTGDSKHLSLVGKTQTFTISQGVNNPHLAGPGIQFQSNSTHLFSTSALWLGLNYFGGAPVAIGTGTPTAQAHVFTTSANRVALGVQAAATQNVNLVTLANSSGVVQLAIAANGRDLVLDTTTGTKWGTSTSQKQGWWNATPVVQPTAVADATDAASVITQLNALLSRLRTIGIIAT